MLLTVMEIIFHLPITVMVLVEHGKQRTELESTKDLVDQEHMLGRQAYQTDS